MYREDRATASPPELQPRRYSEGSDPEEADIDDHLHPRHHGFFPFGGQLRGGSGQWPPQHDNHLDDGPSSPGDPNQRSRNAPIDGPDDPVLRRFLDLLGTGAPRMLPTMPTQNSRNGETFSPLGGGGIRRTTFTSVDGTHTTSWTISSGPMFGNRRPGDDETPPFTQYEPPTFASPALLRPMRSPESEETFFFSGASPPPLFSGLLLTMNLSVFRTILAGPGLRPPHAPEGTEGIERAEGMGGAEGERNARDPAGELLISLQNLLGLIVDPANARHGDAVYTQEALDRIISNLMEANPQSNAAPPASDAALEGLERKKMDAEMLAQAGGNVECTVCIDEIKIGDEVIYLPCKHWFHETCVVMWLREHNTCPICRTPIETNNAGAQPNTAAGREASSSPGAQAGAGFGDLLPGMFPSMQPRTGSNRFRTPDAGSQPRGRVFGGFSSFRTHDSLGRNSPGISADREQRWPNAGSRRTSMSPPNITDRGSGTRTRSPSTNSRRSGQPDQENQRESGSRTFGWIRDHFTGRSNR